VKICADNIIDSFRKPQTTVSLTVSHCCHWCNGRPVPVSRLHKSLVPAVVAVGGKLKVKVNQLVYDIFVKICNDS